MVCLQFVSRHDLAPMWPGPAQSALPDCTVRGVHIRCVLTPAPHRKHSTRRYLNLPDPTRRTRASVCLLLPVCWPLKETLWTLIRASRSVPQGRPLFYMIRGFYCGRCRLVYYRDLIYSNTNNLWPSLMNGNTIKRRGAQRCLMICFLLSRSQAGCQSRQISLGADQPRDLDWVKCLIGQVKPFPSASSKALQMKLHTSIAILIWRCQILSF